jgi:hypothetical protein
MKPGDLVKYDHPANRTLGIVKSITQHSSSGDLVLVQWCNDRQVEENIPEAYLKNLTGTLPMVI